MDGSFTNIGAFQLTMYDLAAVKENEGDFWKELDSDVGKLKLNSVLKLKEGVVIKQRSQTENSDLRITP